MTVSTPNDTPSGGAEVLVSTRLLGRERQPGDRLTAEELSPLTADRIALLARTGVLAVGRPGERRLAEPSDEERAAETALAEARGALAAAARTRDQIAKKRDAARGRAGECEAERRGLALAAATGQASEAKALDRARDAQRKAEMEHEDLSAALTQAEEKVREAEAAVAAAESARRSAEARRLADRRVEAARKIERLIRMLGPAVTDYRSLGHQIARAARTNATPLNADWRLRGHINQMLGLDHVDPALRCPNLAEMERHTLDQVLHYAMKEE